MLADKERKVKSEDKQMKAKAGYEYSRHNDRWMYTDETVWPRPGYANDLEHALRYGQPTRSDLLAAASILAAYTALCRVDSRTRANVVSALKHADSVDRASVSGETE